MTKITWSKEQRDRVKAESETKALFAVGCDTKFGVWKSGGLMSHELAWKLCVFARGLYTEKCPMKAFKEAWPDLWPSDSKKTAKSQR